MQFVILLFASSYAFLIGFELQNRSKHRLGRAARCWSAKNSTSGLKQALHSRKQLLWWSLTKDFHENDKLEVKLRQFEVEVLTKLCILTLLNIVRGKHPQTQRVQVQNVVGENLNFKLT